MKMIIIMIFVGTMDRNTLIKYNIIYINYYITI